MCGIENKEESEDGKVGILFKAGEGVTCLVQSDIFSFHQITEVGDVLKHDQLTIERGRQVLGLNPVMTRVGHGDPVLCSEIKIAEQENV